MDKKDLRKLQGLYLKRAKLNVQSRTLYLDIDKRESFLTPDDGFPGKNEDARDRAEEKAFAADEILSLLVRKQEGISQEETMVDAQIQVLEAERRDSEWSIRQRLVNALGREEEYQDEDPTFQDIIFDEALTPQVEISDYDHAFQTADDELVIKGRLVDEEGYLVEEEFGDEAFLPPILEVVQDSTGSL
mgnify:CR=1 FL=1